MSDVHVQRGRNDEVLDDLAAPLNVGPDSGLGQALAAARAALETP